MTELPKVRIRGLYKIFGETPEAMMPHVLAGLGGEYKAIFALEKCVEDGEEKMVRQFDRLEMAAPGRLRPTIF